MRHPLDKSSQTDEERLELIRFAWVEAKGIEPMLLTAQVDITFLVDLLDRERQARSPYATRPGETENERLTRIDTEAVFGPDEGE